MVRSDLESDRILIRNFLTLVVILVILRQIVPTYTHNTFPE